MTITNSVPDGQKMHRLLRLFQFITRPIQYLEDFAKVYAQDFPNDVIALRPDKRFFVWCKLPPDISAKKLLTAAAEHGVTFLPGNRCYANGQGDDAIRLSFSFQSTQKIVEGIATLGAVLHELRQ